MATRFSQTKIKFIKNSTKQISSKFQTLLRFVFKNTITMRPARR
ncbi:hypothetical protein CAMSH0001_0195 [Campylobacter showae RM3277]|uniref:Uncharacterized protein n=1 Tax=Campylobacter showae RM3277 TaxID=553219 RepID=C6RJ93_9BACT|nr:hypothetical protein CAMSH0001_0195 [Campylobacter showae RM3277]